MKLWKREPKWRWYHGLIALVVVELGNIALQRMLSAAKTRNLLPENIAGEGTEGNDAYYLDFKQPVFAPPAWAFIPIWLVNNTLVIWGILRVLNKPSGTPGRTKYLALQAISLGEYMLFNTAYFGLRSPINGAVLTDTNLVILFEALRTAVVDLHDRKVALSLVTVLPWLLLAAPLATLIAMWNRDEFYNQDAIINPHKRWIKSTQQGENEELS